MFTKTALLALAAALAEAAAPQGFNYGAARADGSAYTQSDFEGLFKQAQNLPGTSGFSSARLYTMQQAGANGQVISAIPAAINTKTSLLLGMWVSGGKGDEAFNAELGALKSAVQQYGDKLKGLVVGISVGSEDLYRISPTGLASPNSGPGRDPLSLANYTTTVKQYLAGTALNGVPVGHVDTWTAWVNGTNAPVIEAADFLGVDAYPYWQSTEANGIENAQSLFNEAFGNTKGAAKGKQVWITETGYPVVGKTSGAAIASTDNAQKYWQQVGCPNFGSVPTFWYTLEESPTGDNPDFSIYNAQTNKPWFDLSCANVQNMTSSSTSSSSGSTSSTSDASGTSSSSTNGTGASTGSGASNGTYTSGSPSNPSATGPNTGSGSGSAGGSSGTGSGSGSGTSSGSAASPSPATGGAASFSASLGYVLALAAAVAAAF